MLMKLLHISKPWRKSNFWGWEQSIEPFLSQVPPGFDTEASAARGTEPAGLTHPISAILCFSGGCQPAGISSSIHEHHTCGSCCNPSAERQEPADRQTYSSTTRQSSRRSRSSRCTSGQHKPRIWGCCSRKPNILEGCGASHLQGYTHRTC